MDLKNPKWMYLKAILFVFIGIFSFVLLWVESPNLKTAVLLGLMIWAFCRAYYFAFYVIEKYIDPQYKFSGLFSFLKYFLQKKRPHYKCPLCENTLVLDPEGWSVASTGANSGSIYFCRSCHKYFTISSDGTALEYQSIQKT